MPFIKVEEAVEKTYDYVIVGGGTAGLVIAARLTEDPAVSVLVLEAGPQNLGDSMIDMLGQMGATFGNPQYDWNFPVANQKGRASDSPPWQRGKGLGGSSAMNFYCWIKPPAFDMDAIEALGNPGWNWTEYEKYSRKVETFHPPAQEQLDFYPHTYNPAFRGNSGPIHVTIAPHFHTIDAILQKSLVNRGLKPIEDAYGGDITGAWIGSSNIDPKAWNRSYSTAYLLPNLERPNLNVLTEALVSRVLFANAQGNEDLIATGVECIVGGKKYVVQAGKEVVICAGAIKSPHILELSGIGHSDVLQKIGVDSLVDLPGVGENVQEHISFAISFELDPNIHHETWDMLKDPEHGSRQKDMYLQGKGLHRNGINAFAYFPLSAIDEGAASSVINKLEKEYEMLEKEGKLTPGLKSQLDIQIKAYKDNTVPDCELVGYAGMYYPRVPREEGKSYISVVSVLNHPISRGIIHSQTNNPEDYPLIDPHYMESDVDVDVLTQQVKFIRSLKDYEPWKSAVGKEVGPSADAQTDEQLREYARNTATTVWHTVGSCSMLPREKQGVVDPRLKVYGTKNLRVADLSIIPLHIAAHTQVTAYVVGEKAADLIKADYVKN
ncbi:hypothetical protein D9613_003994 [Agrocybe pediades]|uniref:pyranose dehydrogenase (acceptor) n=1 Tax=Agrocybe pediades TaxID=84607 RepID=A0A8H4VIB4_9AGAR|nr:hypothetical protein D9613_003994 [Agrocybe pediades]